jgi:GT2 family glycosyltransferase
MISLVKTEYNNYRIYLVDNASSDGSPGWIKNKYPQVQIIRSESNLGYAGGCNLGIRSTSEEYIVLLNNDTEVEPGWLDKLLLELEKDISIAAAQPKILWLKDRSMFDYSGGAGGMMDIYGYPYCLGRLFESKEKDEGQYDGSVGNIFWASGSASIYRRSALNKVGLLDEDFFMHMEEIDLAWRLQLAGYRIVSIPSSVIYHLSGGSLPAGNFRKMYLNHRNSLLMLWKNYSILSLLGIWPARVLLECMALTKALISGNIEWARAIVQAMLWIHENPRMVLGKHRQIQKIRLIKDSVIMNNMYRGSIALKYFLWGRRTAQEL